MNDFDVAMAAVALLAVLAWIGAWRGWFQFSASASARVVPAAKRGKPEQQAAAEDDVARLRDGRAA